MEVVTDQSDHEVESALRIESEQEQPRINSFLSLGRQSSVYSLTLDEFQNTLTSGGKNFESMNMDEFLKSIWTAEGNEAQEENANTAEAKTSLTNMNPQYQFAETPKESSNIARQMSLTRQGSLSVPAPLCLKTVEEVWSDINRTQQSSSNIPHASSRQQEPTYGEMTLEDFLVKAGVVREEGAVAQAPPPRPRPQPQPHLPQPQLQPHPPQLQPHPPQLQPHLQPHLQPQTQPQSQVPYGMYLNCDNTTASNFMILGCGGAGSVGVPNPFKPQPQSGCGNVATSLPGEKSRAIEYQPAVSYGGGVANGRCGTESFGEMSPVSSDGIATKKPGRKRIIDGPVERVIERRQKRMIKNRESAARSRARKHAYTLELEAELNQLKDENTYLRHRSTEIENKYKKQKRCIMIKLLHEECLEAAKTKAQAKAKDKPGLLRRNFSCPF